jgi:class 3 adenylate cyclase
MSYDYKQSQRNILKILTSKTIVEQKNSIPMSKEGFSFENGIYAKTSAIFIDIVNSSVLFKQAKPEKLARMIRAFVTELIKILKDDPNRREIGIRGDCVYGIYSTPHKNDVRNVFDMACTVNSFLSMFRKILEDNSLPEITAGIGLGYDGHELIIKTGFGDAGISDLVWIGDAVVDASKLSSEAGRNGHHPIFMDSGFFTRIRKGDAGKGKVNADLIDEAQSNKLGEMVYSTDAVTFDFS